MSRLQQSDSILERGEIEQLSQPASAVLTVSVVIPAYNECFTIREVLRRVFSRPEVTEVIVVDDGSTDGTRERLRQLESRYTAEGRSLRLHFREKNGGKGEALKDGFRLAKCDVTIVQDADLEYDPEDYPALLAPFQRGEADVVYGSRFMAKERNALLFWHMVANRILTLLCNFITNLNLTDIWTGYKAFRTDLIQKLPIISRGFDFEPEITVKLAQLGCRIYEVPVRYTGRSRAEGKKIGLKDAFIGNWRLVQTALFGDLGELAVGERTLRIMADAPRYNAYIAGELRALLGPRTIEIGSGVGNIARFLLDRDQLTLTDPDPGYVRRLLAQYGRWEYVDVRQLDIEHPGDALENLHGRFDSVVCSNVLEHIRDDRKALANMVRLLRPGGRLVLLVPAHPALFGTLDQNLGHWRRYDRAALESRMEEAGLRVTSLRSLNAIAMPGWFFNGRVLNRKVVSSFQVRMFDRLTPLVKRFDSLDLPFGLSLVAVAERADAIGQDALSRNHG